GTIHALVVRRGNGVHDLPARVTIDRDAGIVGDRWLISEPRDPDGQISFIERRVAAVVSGARTLEAAELSRLHEAGDNLIVDLDLSVAALPVGTRLAIGTALVEITGKPHAGCHKFQARFGEDAVRWMNARERRPRRLRGVFAKVIEGGEVSVGERITRVP